MPGFCFAILTVNNLGSQESSDLDGVESGDSNSGGDYDNKHYRTRKIETTRPMMTRLPKMDKQVKRLFHFTLTCRVKRGQPRSDTPRTTGIMYGRFGKGIVNDPSADVLQPSALARIYRVYDIRRGAHERSIHSFVGDGPYHQSIKRLTIEKVRF